MKLRSGLIYGRHPVLNALMDGEEVDKVYVKKGVEKEFLIELKEACRNADVYLSQVPIEKIERTVKQNHPGTDINHQGIIAFKALVTYSKLEDLIPFIIEQGRVPFFLVLDGITDVRNFGAIVRSAVSFKVDAILFEKKNTANINADTVKASAGTIDKVKLCRMDSLSEIYKELKLNGIVVYASDLSGELTINDLDLEIPLAIVIGSEGSGICSVSKHYADFCFKINMSEEVESLNASVATGILLNEVYRVRG